MARKSLIQHGLILKNNVSRIVVVGTSGSGKTTLAHNIAKKLNISHIELDAVHWQPNWTPVQKDVFLEKIHHIVSNDKWVIDGNYSIVRDIMWQRAEMIIWLDYSLPVIFWQVLVRSLRRAITREVLWGSNRESWRRLFFSRNSILLWVLQTYRRRRREYPIMFEQPEYKHLHVLRLRSPAQTKKWLDEFEHF